jgi:large subunit ribosomal protein L10
MVSEKKKQIVSEVGKEIERYSVVGILDMFKLPSSQLHEIRETLRGEARILMVKKRLMKRILENSKLKDVEKLLEYIQGEPAFLLSNTDPFKLAAKISKSKSSAMAKPGDVAPKDIIIKAGPTSLSAGPVIGELQRIKIPASVDGEKIAINKDTTVAEEGENIPAEVADVLSKLNIKPMMIGLNLVVAWENGMIYEKDVMFTDPQEYIDKITQAYSSALNLSINVGYFTKENIELLLAKAHSEASALADSANILTKDNAPKIVGKAGAQAKALKDKLKIEESEPASEETKTEEKPKESEDKGKDKEEEKSEPEKEAKPKEDEKPKKEEKPEEEAEKAKENKKPKEEEKKEKKE